MTKYRIGFGFPKNRIFASAVWIAFASNALATDIQCNNPGLQGFEEVICEYAILNFQYERIFKQQTDMVESERISPDVVDAWRKKRDQCTNVACMDSVFSEWKTTAETTEKSREVNQSNEQSSSPPQEPVASPAASVDQQPSAPAPQVLPSDFPAESAANEAKAPAAPTNQASPPEVQTVPAAPPNSDTSNGAIGFLILLALIVAPIWYLKNKFSGGRSDDRQPRHIDEDDEDERTKRKQGKRVEKPMYASSDESFPRGWTSCATCDYWVGTRDVIYGHVKVQKKDYDGKCAQGPVVRAHFKASFRCTHWKKWGALKE